MPATPPPDPLPRCAHCGERITPGRRPGTWTHKARIVASCDLDSDHRPEPAAPADGPQAGPSR